MRPGVSHPCGAFRKDPSAAPRRIISIFLFALGFSWLCGAKPASPQGRLGPSSPLSVEQVRDAVFLAPPVSELSVDDTKLLKVTHRPDLEDLLSTLIHQAGTRGLYLYQVEIPAQVSFDGPRTWIVAVAASRPEAYELYTFKSKANRADLAGEFNRLTSQLSLSLTKYDMANFAAFFLETAIPMSPGEIVLDQEALRGAVGRQYFTKYDEAWRSIEAYSQWWQAFSEREKIAEFAPRTEIEEGGWYRVTLNRVVATEDTHPQLEQWQLEISLWGNVRVTGMRTIFPKTAQWIFYDSPGQPYVLPFRP